MFAKLQSIIQTSKKRISNSDIGKRMVTGAFWQMVGTSTAKFIVLVSGILCAHILGKSEYGQFNMVRSTINMFVVFGTAGMGLTATKYISEYRKNNKDRIGSIYRITNGFAFFSGLVCALLIGVLAPILAEKTLNTPELTTPIRIGALLLFVTVLNGAQQGALSGFEDFRSIAINTFIGSIAESVLLLVGGYFWGVTGAVLGFGTGFVVLYFCNLYAINKRLEEDGLDRKTFKVQRSDLKLLVSFSLPAALSSIMVTPVFWLARTMLVNSSSFEELAVYEAADQWKIIILFIPGALSQVVLPILSSLIGESVNRYKRVLLYNIAINASVAFILAIGVSLFSKQIMGLYGKDYQDVWPIIILAISTIPTAVSAVVGLSISSRAKMWTGLLFNLIWGLLVIGLNYIFLNNDMGASGLSLAILCAYTIHTIIQTIYLMHLLKTT